jgi:hypothetical protein
MLGGTISYYVRGGEQKKIPNTCSNDQLCQFKTLSPMFWQTVAIIMK